MSNPSNVVAALARVTEELPGIAKGGRAAPQQGGYSYRGIDQITKEVQPLLAKYGVVVVPSVRTCEVKDITVQGKPWTDTTLKVDWKVYGPGGLEDQLTASTMGMGRDNADKGINKAMTQAFKYLLMDMLCISDPKDDNDGVHSEADLQSPLATDDQKSDLLARIAELPEAHRDALKAEWKQALPPASRLTEADLADALRLLETYEEAADSQIPTTAPESASEATNPVERARAALNPQTSTQETL